MKLEMKISRQLHSVTFSSLSTNERPKREAKVKRKKNYYIKARAEKFENGSELKKTKENTQQRVFLIHSDKLLLNSFSLRMVVEERRSGEHFFFGLFINRFVSSAHYH